MSILKQKTNDVELKKYAVNYMEQTGSFAYTLKVLDEVHATLIAEIAKLGGNEILSAIVKMLAEAKK